MDFAGRPRHRSDFQRRGTTAYQSRCTKAHHSRCTETRHTRCTKTHHRRCPKAQCPTLPQARGDAGNGQGVPRELTRALRPAAAAQSPAGPSARVPPPVATAQSQVGSSARGMGRGTAAVKGPALGGRLTRRDEPARCINDEDAGHNSNGHRPQLCLHCQRTAPLFRIIRQFQGASRFSAARISVPSLLLERAAMSRKASPRGAFSVHCGLIATCVSEFSRCDRL